MSIPSLTVGGHVGVSKITKPMAIVDSMVVSPSNQQEKWLLFGQVLLLKEIRQKQLKFILQTLPPQKILQRICIFFKPPHTSHPPKRHRIMRHHGGFQFTREPAKVVFFSSWSSCKHFLFETISKLILKVDENFE